MLVVGGLIDNLALDLSWSEVFDNFVVAVHDILDLSCREVCDKPFSDDGHDASCDNLAVEVVEEDDDIVPVKVFGLECPGMTK